MGKSSYNLTMRDWLDNQYQNLFLYVPFLMAIGAACYYSLNAEPNTLITILGAVVLGVGIFIRRIPNWVRGIMLILFGFFYAATFTNIINTPPLKHDMHNIDIFGTIDNIDYTPDKHRIYLNTTDGMAVRVSVDTNLTADVNIGDMVKINGGLFRPAPAYAPETFDYARWAYFNGLSATGYANDIMVLESNGVGGINALRDFIHRRTDSFLADTLVLGYKAAVPKADSEIWTATGVGHVWSISGFHMTLVGGWLFALFYLIFRSVPYITRRIPARVPAMGVAWLGLLFYLFLSGADVATTRAFLMTTLVFTAFVFGRSAISLRNVALAFCFIFLLNPHYIMQAGFQLSFSAVFGLVWLYSVVKPKMPRNKFLRIIYACVLTSLTATIFTAPFVAMHFGAIPIYGLIGNLILLPIFSFAIMPLVLVGVICAVFGFNGLLTLSQTIYDYTFVGAQYIADLPFSSVPVGHISNLAMLFFIAGFAGLVLIKNIKLPINYIVFLIFATAGVATAYHAPRPVFYATYDHELVGFLRDDGNLEFNKSRASNHYFAFDTWKQLNGQSADTPNHRRKHDDGLYRYGNIVYVQKFVPLMNNLSALCADPNVKYIVSYFEIDSPTCNHKILHGGFVIYENDRVKYTPSARPWH